MNCSNGLLLVLFADIELFALSVVRTVSTIWLVRTVCTILLVGTVRCSHCLRCSRTSVRSSVDPHITMTLFNVLISSLKCSYWPK